MTVDNAGNSLTTARVVTLGATAQTFTDWVGVEDPSDYYRFTLAAPANLRLSLGGLSADVDLFLQDADGMELRRSDAAGAAAEAISFDALPAGTYYVHVESYTNSSNYNLQAAAMPLSGGSGGSGSLDPGDQPGTAQAITLSATPQTWSDAVDRNDTDIYRFSVSANSLLRVNFSATGPADASRWNVGLFDSGLVQRNMAFGLPTDTPATFSVHLLAPGSYYVAVSTGGPRIDFGLTMSAPQLPPDQAGDTRATARAISVSTTPSSWTDWVGSADVDDYYGFTLAVGASLRLALAELETNNTKTVRILNALGTVLQSASGSAADINTRLAATELSPGPYFVQVFSNSTVGAYTSYTLTLSTAAITGRPEDRAGNLLAAARPITLSSSNQVFNDWVGSTDRDDYYVFTLAAPADLRLSLGGLAANADLSLLSASGATLRSSVLSGTASESIFAAGLAAGTYHVYVRAAQSTGDTPYTLNAQATASSADLAGNSLTAALAITLTPSVQTWSDVVGTADRDDYFRFTLAQAGPFSAELSGLASNADLFLLGSTGGLLRGSTSPDVTTERITLDTLAAGTYYVQVRAAQGSGDTPYTLKLSAGVAPSPADNAGNTLATARTVSLGTQAQTWTDWVGAADTDDYYRFTLTTASNLSVSLSGLSADADLSLLNAAGSVINSSSKPGSADESMASNLLAAGTYYVRVQRFSGDTAYGLTMSLPNDVIGPSPGVGLGILSAKPLGGTASTLNWTVVAGGHSYSGDFQLGHKDGDPTLKVRNANATVVGDTLTIRGDIDLMEAGGDRALFSGEILFDTRSGVGRISETAGLLKLAGVTWDHRSLSLAPNAAQIIGAIGLPNAFISGIQALELPPINWVSAGFQPLSFSVQPNSWKVFGNSELVSKSGLTVAYQPLADKLSFTGDLSFVPNWKWLGSNARATLNASDPGLQYRNGTWDGKLEISLRDIHIGKVFELRELSLSIDTIANKLDFVGLAALDFSGKKSGPIGIIKKEVGITLSIGASWSGDLTWDSQRLESVAVAFEGKPGIPVPGTGGLFLTKVGGGIEDLSAFQSGTKPWPTITGSFGFDSVKELMHLDVDGSFDSEGIVAGKVAGYLGKKALPVATFTGELELNYKSSSSAYRLELSLPADKIKDKVPAKLSWLKKVLPDQPFTASITLTGKGDPAEISASAAITSVPWAKNLGGGVYLRTVWDDIETNDYLKFWLTYSTSLWKDQYKLTLEAGVQWFFHGDIQFFGAEGIPPVGSWQATPAMESMLITASWAHPSANVPRTRVIQYSDAAHSRVLASYDEVQYEANGIAVLGDLGTSTSLSVFILKPTSGVWDLQLLDTAGLGAVNFSASTPTVPLFLELKSAQAGAGSVTLSYQSASSLPAAKISFYADLDGQGFDGELLGSADDTDAAAQFQWLTAGQAAGQRWFYAVMDAQGATPLMSYFPAPVTIAASVAPRPGASAGNDWLAGTAATEYWQGGAGDDVLVSGGGADTLDGGAGRDTAILVGRASGYRREIVSADLQRYADIDPSDGDQGTVVLQSIERVAFTAEANLQAVSSSREASLEPLAVRVGELRALQWAGDTRLAVPDGGIVVLQWPAGPGQWQTSNDGQTWTPRTTAELSAAGTGMGLWLDDTAWVRLLPSASGSGTAVLTYYPWDGPQTVVSGGVAAATPGSGGVGSSAIGAGFIVQALARIQGSGGNDVLRGNAADESLIGGAGNDVLRPGGGQDVLDGGTGFDVAVFDGERSVSADLALGIAQWGADKLQFKGIEGLRGSDLSDSLRGLDGAANLPGERFRGAGGNDSISGGTGLDIAEFSGRVADYEIVRTAGTLDITVTHRFGGADGVDTLSGVEGLLFADRLVYFGNRAEDVARVAFVLWSPAIVKSPTLFSKGLSFYTNEFGYSIDTLCQVALNYWPETGAALASKLVANSPGTTLTAAGLLALMVANGGESSLAGRAAAVKAAALDAATTQQLALTGVTTQGLVATLNFDSDVYFGPMPG